MTLMILDDLPLFVTCTRIKLIIEEIPYIDLKNAHRQQVINSIPHIVEHCRNSIARDNLCRQAYGRKPLCVH